MSQVLTVVKVSSGDSSAEPSPSLRCLHVCAPLLLQYLLNIIKDSAVTLSGHSGIDPWKNCDRVPTHCFYKIY